MRTYLTRRETLAAGSLAAGSLFAGSCSDREQPAVVSVRETASPQFLTPWSPPAGQMRDLTPGTTPTRLCTFSKEYRLDYPKDISITELVKHIRDAGYTAAGTYVALDGDNPWLQAPESDIAELKQALAEYDVMFFDVMTVGNNIHPEAAYKAKSLKYTAEACETAERIGCPMVTTHAGTKSTEHPIAPHPDNWTWETWKEVVAAMKQILKDTAGMKVALGIEAVNMQCINSPESHLRLIEDVGDDRIKVCLDPVNMLSLRNYYRTTELINTCFDLLGEHIITVHAKDSYILPNKMSVYMTEVTPGTGILDYETFLARCSRLEWPRPLLIEHLPHEEYPVARKHIEETAAKVGVTLYS